MKNELIKKIQNTLNEILDLPISFVEMGKDSVIRNKNGKFISLIEKLHSNHVEVTHYKGDIVICTTNIEYCNLTYYQLKMIDKKLETFKDDVKDFFYESIVDNLTGS